MKKFLIRITIFFAVMIAADFIFGKVMFYTESQSSSKNYHCMYEADEDILILGSSYAVRNIVPSVIEDSLGMSCYNAGEAGNGALVAWARYNMFKRIHMPKLVIYTLTPGFDYIKSDAYPKYLNAVKPYYGKEESVDAMYNNLVEWSDGLILNSNIVKYNSYCAQLLYYWLSKKNMGLQGYEPLYGTFTPYEGKHVIEEKYEIDDLKMAYLELLFNDIKTEGIPILCVLPPDYRENLDLHQYKDGLCLCEKYDIPVINDKYCEGLSRKSQYFYDIAHLNDEGARLYTAILSKKLKTILNK